MKKKLPVYIPDVNPHQLQENTKRAGENFTCVPAPRQWHHLLRAVLRIAGNGDRACLQANHRRREHHADRVASPNQNVRGARIRLRRIPTRRDAR
jgi:hypothetical protein